jgi:hypothetical protein
VVLLKRFDQTTNHGDRHRLRRPKHDHRAGVSLRVCIFHRHRKLAIALGAATPVYLAMRYGVEVLPPFVLASSRYLIAGPIMLMLSAIFRLKMWPSKQEWGWLAVIGVLMLGCGNTSVMWAEQYIPSGLAALLVLLAAGCAGGPPPPDWQLNSVGALQRFRQLAVIPIRNPDSEAVPQRIGQIGIGRMQADLGLRFWRGSRCRDAQHIFELAQRPVPGDCAEAGPGPGQCLADAGEIEPGRHCPTREPAADHRFVDFDCCREMRPAQIEGLQSQIESVSESVVSHP